jgi:hypothetical protein
VKMLIGMYWEIMLGDEENAGYDVEIVIGGVEGRGMDGVGVEAVWAEENLGTPFERGGPLMVRFLSGRDRFWGFWDSFIHLRCIGATGCLSGFGVS